ncbi:hypothetical protein F2Q68_00025730 [Brassica cretica]|uniref:Uncharacterized protein n=1 Tax=Brassica cretica TaxID=69181 RepID=A0A8S9IF42_BRACR|nr:hypothetical protein F2Q68_00025730 [Brassica cretica]
MNCWEVTGTKLSVKNEVSAAETESGVKEESGRPRKKDRKEKSVEARAEAIKVAPTEARSDARSEASATVGVMTKEEIEKSFRDIADAMRDGFGMLLEEIKWLGDRMEAGEKKTSVINFVQKDFGEMFLRWDFDVENSAAENIIKVMFNAKSRWKWTMDCWEVTGTKLSVKKEVSAAEIESGVKEESGRPQKKARKEKSIEARA